MIRKPGVRTVLDEPSHTLETTASILGVTRQTISRWIQEKKLKGTTARDIVQFAISKNKLL
jgi:plasmid maintenance system antidote protein VapI